MNSGKIKALQLNRSITKATSNTQHISTQRANLVSTEAVTLSLPSLKRPETSAAKARETNRKKPELSDAEATELAESIHRTLKHSAEAFGMKATLFHDLSTERARDLLR